MTLASCRSLFVVALLAGLVASASVTAADKPKEIRVDWATYNPVSMVLKDQGFLEKEFAKDAVPIRWVQTNSSANAKATIRDLSSLESRASLEAKAIEGERSGQIQTVCAASHSCSRT